MVTTGAAGAVGATTIATEALLTTATDPPGAREIVVPALTICPPSESVCVPITMFEAESIVAGIVPIRMGPSVVGDAAGGLFCD
jgi:hypothetical protein